MLYLFVFIKYQTSNYESINCKLHLNKSLYKSQNNVLKLKPCIKLNNNKELTALAKEL